MAGSPEAVAGLLVGWLVGNDCIDRLEKREDNGNETK